MIWNTAILPILIGLHQLGSKMQSVFASWILLEHENVSEAVTIILSLNLIILSRFFGHDHSVLHWRRAQYMFMPAHVSVLARTLGLKPPYWI